MNFDKTQPDKYYCYIKKQKGFPEKFIEELFLIAKLTNDKEVKKEATEILKKAADEDILNALKNRSKFSDKNDWKATRKNLLLLLKLATLSSTLKIGKMYTLLEGDFRVYIHDDLKLDEIPEEIGRLDGITDLHFDLRSKDITIPDTIGDINLLETLRLSGFGINALPKGISRLKNLKKLIINLHSIKEIPDWITRCEALEELEFGGYLSYSHIAYNKLPDLRGVKNLKSLEISTMKIDEIPEEFFNLPQLEDFKLVNVKGLKSLPSTIKNMKELKSLEIANCPQMEELPVEITQLSNLEALMITSLPSMKVINGKILFMPGVKELEFANCSPEIDMSEVGKSKVKILYIRDKEILNQFLKYSDKFSHLEKLIILECKGLEAIPESINKLKALKYLRVEQFTIKTFPETIGELDSLETLEIRSEMETFPESLSKLKNLKTFSIESPKLSFSCKALPNSIETLSIGATSIDLAVNEPLAPQIISLSGKEVRGSENLRNFNGITDFVLTNGDGLLFKDICSLTSIKRLYLSSYPDDITSEVTALKNLEYIEIWNEKDLKNKRITPLLGELSKLTTLKINYWSGDTLLDMITPLNCIEEIELNEIEVLGKDESFDKFIEILKNKKNLKRLLLSHLDITNAKFEKLTLLTQLEGLRINFEPTDRIPNSILNMKHLKFLSLRFLSNIKELPDWIGELKSLENLEIEHMYLDTLPASLADLPLLKRLSIYGTKPKEVPEELNNLNLDELKIWFSRGNPIRQSVLDVLINENTRLVDK